jgi:choline-sulfatase
MSKRPMNVILIVSDELAANVLPVYGGTQPDTPAIDELAEAGTTFDSAYCNSPVCTPSRYSMLSGRYPWDIDVYHNQSPTPSDYPSIASMLNDRGYETVGIGKMHFKGSDQMWGYQRRPYGDFGGLSHQPDPLPTAPRLSYVADAGPADIDEKEMQDVIVGRLAGEFLQSRDTTRPFFLHLSFNFPHYPLRPPSRLFNKYYPDRADLPRLPDVPEAEHEWMKQRREVYKTLLGEGSHSDEQIRRARAAYYACTELMDEQVGIVLEELERLGLAEDTAILFTADHGDMLGEHGTWEKNCFYEQSVRVPLIVKVPGVPGGRVTDVVELVDLFPTVEELTRSDSSWTGGTDGESLLPLITQTGSRQKAHAVSQLAPTYVEGVAQMLRVGRWKQIQYSNASPSLFDLETDPEELEDLGLQPEQEWPTVLAEFPSPDFARVNERSKSAELAVHPSYANMTPNQYRDADGTLTDAETFYGPIDWVRPTRVDTKGVTRVRPQAP